MKQINNKLSLLMVTGVVLSPFLEQALAQSPSSQSVGSHSDTSISDVIKSIIHLILWCNFCCVGYSKMCAKSNVSSSYGSSGVHNYVAMESSALRIV